LLVPLQLQLFYGPDQPDPSVTWPVFDFVDPLLLLEQWERQGRLPLENPEPGSLLPTIERRGRSPTLKKPKG